MTPPWEPHEPAPEKPKPTPPPPPPRAGNPAPGLYEALTGHPLPEFAELRERYGDPATLKPIPGGAATLTGPLAQTDVGEVDLRAMLKDSPGAIIKRDEIGRVLRRRYLATQLVAMLPVEVSARLADVLRTLENRIIAETVAAISKDVTAQTVEAINRIDAEISAKREELTLERFHGSRLD